MQSAIELQRLRFAYPDSDPVFDGLDLEIPSGSRTLLIGANGVGKSTFLQLIAGRHILPAESLRVFGSPPFFDMSLASRISLVDGDFPLTVDLRVEELLAYPTPGVDRGLEHELLELLEISRAWRMCRVSEGQRRRVQLLMALRKPSDLLLLDEVTSHLDIVVRSDLLRWLKARSGSFGTTIVYTTHILDGLREMRWPTHLALMKLRRPVQFREYDPARDASLLGVAESWIRSR